MKKSEIENTNIEGFFGLEGRISKENFEKRIYLYNTERQSWCYGSLGMMRALYKCALTIKSSFYQSVFLEKLIELSSLSVDDLNLESATFCHGYSGALMINHLMYKDSGKIIFEDTSNKLAHKIISLGDSNYKYFFYNYDNFFDGKIFEAKKNIRDLSIISGSCGVMLSLLSYSRLIDSRWANIFMI